MSPADYDSDVIIKNSILCYLNWLLFGLFYADAVNQQGDTDRAQFNGYCWTAKPKGKSDKKGSIDICGAQKLARACMTKNYKDCHSK